MKKLHISLQIKFLLSIILIIVPVLGVIFTWTGIQNEKQAKEQVLTQARVLSRQVILTRQWITDCGGVMVPLMTDFKLPEDGISDLPLQW